MPKDAIGVGIVGTGFGVRVQGPVWASTPGVRVTAVCSRDPKRAREAADQLKAPHAVTDLGELARLPDVDLVSVTTPPDEHYAGVMAALDAGKHVLCEKPFAMNAAQAQKMLEAARAKNVIHLVNHEFRCRPHHQAMHRMVNEGFLGILLHVQSTFISDNVTTSQQLKGRWWFEAERAGGWLGASGSHSIDTLRFIFGEISSLSAALKTVVERPVCREGRITSNVDDTFFLMLRFANGALGSCISGSAVVLPAGPPRIEAYGSKGTMLAEGERLFAAKQGEQLEEVRLEKADVPTGSDSHYVPFGLWTRRIAAAVRQGKKITPDFEDGLRCQRIIDAARRSAAERRWVDIPQSG